MSQRPNTLALGVFSAGIVLLLVALLIVFGNRGLFNRNAHFVLFFDGSINGLNIGAPVSFQGVKIGEVTDIKLAVDEGSEVLIPVFITVRPDAFTTASGSEGEELINRLIQRGMRAQLKLQSLLTGQLYIEFAFYPNTPVNLRGKFSEPQELPTIPTALQELSKTLEDIRLEELVSSARSALNGIDRLVNHPDTLAAVTHARDAMQKLDHSLIQIDARIGPLLNNLDSTLNEVNTLVASVNRDYPALSDNLGETATEAKRAVQQFNRSLQALEHGLSGDSALAHELGDTLKALKDAARSFRQLSDDLGRHPESLLRGKPAHVAEPAR